MLAALNLGAVLLGIASGGLATSVVGFGLSALLTVIGFDGGPGIGLVGGIIVGLMTGGYLAGATSKHSERFHGSVTGLAFAFVIMTIALFGESRAPISTILLLALISVVVAGSSGWVAGRRKLTKS